MLSRGHTTNKCWPTCVKMLANKFKKVCRVFKKLANILCWPTMFAVCELVPFLLANKRQTVRCDWLAVVNIMTQNGRMNLTLYTSPFYLYIIHDCTETDFGRLRFHLRAIKQITAAATSSSSADSAVSAILLCVV